MSTSTLKDYPIGSIVKYGHDTLVVEPSPNNEPVCTRCYFSEVVRKRLGLTAKFSCYIHKMACTSHMRKDMKHVIFILK